jgi:DNA-binding transcriptional LysR family regulator
LTIGRDVRNPRSPHLSLNNLAAIIRAVEHGVGIAVLPDYCVASNSGLVRLLPQADMPSMDCFLVYAEEMKNVARVQAFRDFLVSKAQRWRY